MKNMKNDGLNIGSLKVANIALLYMWCWHFTTGIEGLWINVIKALYGTNRGMQDDISAYPKNSGG